MMHYYEYARSYEEFYKAECRKDYRLKALNTAATILLLSIIATGIYHLHALILVVPVCWIAYILKNRIRKMIKSKYLYL